jgi:hypothetical protein
MIAPASSVLLLVAAALAIAQADISPLTALNSNLCYGPNNLHNSCLRLNLVAVKECYMSNPSGFVSIDVYVYGTSASSSLALLSRTSIASYKTLLFMDVVLTAFSDARAFVMIGYPAW